MTREQRINVRRMWETGVKSAEIADYVGLTSGYIRSLAKRRGWAQRKAGRPRGVSDNGAALASLDRDIRGAA